MLIHTVIKESLFQNANYICEHEFSEPAVRVSFETGSRIKEEGAE
jgi:hypothetical protein